MNQFKILKFTERGWIELDRLDTLESAIYQASCYCETVPDDMIRIETPDGKIL